MSEIPEQFSGNGNPILSHVVLFLQLVDDFLFSLLSYSVCGPPETDVYIYNNFWLDIQTLQRKTNVEGGHRVRLFLKTLKCPEQETKI